MKILIVSDNHGQSKELYAVLKKTRPFDYLIHLGDTEGTDRMIRREAKTPVTIVRGNNDFFSDAENEAVLTFGNCRIFAVHGHTYGVSMGTGRLMEEAKKRGCNVAMFGHTHRPCLDQSDPEITLINPGSLSYPRQEGRRPSYVVMSIDRYGEAHYTLNYLER